jgi:hypothetical protein
MRSEPGQGMELVSYRSYAITRESSDPFNLDPPWRCEQIQFSSRDLKRVKSMIDLRIHRLIHRRV